MFPKAQISADVEVHRCFKVLANVKVNRPATAGCGRRTIYVRLERPAVAGPVERPVRRAFAAPDERSDLLVDSLRAEMATFGIAS